ncbi:MAG: DUF2612 domain-containing protein [Gammaproteobacteria bacterium]|nr:DUF2612 domain-containing protein [Gammaproteobacteria bacterium]
MATSIQRFDFSINVMRAQLWQYDNATKTTEILQHLNDWIAENNGLFWDSWLVDVFNLETANEFGLSVWSTIFNLPLFADQETSPDDYPAFGFAAYGSAFNQGNFAVDQPFYNLTVEEKRIILRMKAFKILTNPTMKQINEFFSRLFGPLNAYVTSDNTLPMQCVYNFSSSIGVSDRLIKAMQTLDVLPTPATVKATMGIFQSATNAIHFSKTGNITG